MTTFSQDILKHRRFKTCMVGGGRGAFFATYHRAAMRLCDRFQVVAGAFSSNPAASQEAGQALGLEDGRAYPSFQEMAAEETRRPDSIEVAVVVTPNHLHFEPCRLFLEARIPVICDKPRTNSDGEARELMRIAAKNDTFLALTYTYLGYPMVRDLRARIMASELGELRFAYVEYLLEWLANDPSKLGKGGIWRGDPAQAGPTGVLGDIGTHAFNILEYLTGRRCTGLSAKLSTATEGWTLEDSAVVQLVFERGLDGLMWASLVAPGHRNGLRVKIVGSKGTAEWCQEAPETLHVSRLGQADLVYRRGLGDMTEDGLASVSLPAGNPEAYVEALANLYADFAHALEAGPKWRESLRPPVQGLEEGLRGVLLSQACLASDKTRSWVPFPSSEGRERLPMTSAASR
jgi:predicted dehydrogenase